MTIKVLGAGFGRTGTMSLKIALEMLGLGPCYHMAEVFKNPGHSDLWAEAADGNFDWNRLLAGYQSTVDWPSTYFWRELANVYPESKIILTVRSTESWVKSAHNTIFRQMQIDPEKDNPVLLAQKKMVQRLILNGTFAGDLQTPAHIGAIYEKHNAEVINAFPAERLLVYESGQGWEPLCKFLGIPVPTAEYPKVNTTDEFQQRVTAIRNNEH